MVAERPSAGMVNFDRTVLYASGWVLLAVKMFTTFRTLHSVEVIAANFGGNPAGAESLRSCRKSKLSHGTAEISHKYVRDGSLLRGTGSTVSAVDSVPRCMLLEWMT